MGRQYLRATNNVQEKEKRGGKYFKKKKSAQENRTCTKDHALLLHKNQNLGSQNKFSEKREKTHRLFIGVFVN